MSMIIFDFSERKFSIFKFSKIVIVASFCSLKFNTKFTRFKKIEVRGENASPLYKWLITQNEEGKAKAIKWNFTKFLINRQGEVVARFAPTEKPEDFIDRVKEELQK